MYPVTPRPRPIDSANCFVEWPAETANRPEALETALAARPGRIDQAIEFALPDEEGRAKLVRLYSLGVSLSEEIITEITKRTESVSASFIKELMRRIVKLHIEADGTGMVTHTDIDNALDEMRFKGGRLNLKLLDAKAYLTVRLTSRKRRTVLRFSF